MIRLQCRSADEFNENHEGGRIMKIPSRFKNVGLWVSAASSILIIAQTFGVDISPDKYNDIVNSVLSLLVVLGILNNPTTDNKFYGDDK